MTRARTIGALLAVLLVVFAAGTAAQAPDPALAARLERLRALRLERPADGLLAYYQALTHAALGQHDAALAEPQPDNVVTGGIDGLYWHRGDLVGVQNGCNPGRVIRVALVDGGTRVGGTIDRPEALSPPRCSVPLR